MKRGGFRLPAATVLLLVAASPGCWKEDRPAAVEGQPLSRAASIPFEYETRPENIRVEYRSIEMPSEFPAGKVVEVKFEVRNAGARSWAASGDLPLRFGYHWSDPERTGNWDSIIWDDGNRGHLRADLAPAGEAAVTLPVKAPAKPNRGYKLIIAPLLEGSGPGWTTEVPYVATVDVR